MSELASLDEADHLILDYLRQNGRMSAAELAPHVNLTASAVRRRIARLEASGVIDRYTIVVNHDRIGTSVEAYVELSFAGNADVHAILKSAMQRNEVREAMTIAGDLDALVRLRVRDLPELRKAVTRLRANDQVTGGRTLVVLGRWWHGSSPGGDGE
jgi:Lrp/AsnC family leucine-responsive transcriptional regulator